MNFRVSVTIESIEKKKSYLDTRISGEKLNLRAKWVGIVSSLRAVTRHPGGFLACHNRGLSLARTDGRLMAAVSELFIPLDYAPRALRAEPRRSEAAETNEPAEMERARRRGLSARLRGSRSTIADRCRRVQSAEYCTYMHT